MFSVDVMRKNMNRAASSFDSAAVLYHEVADRLLERLDYIKIDPKSVLDVGSKTGRVLGELSKRYSGKCVYGYEPAAAMLNRIHGANPSLNAPLICGDYDLFPLQSEIVDVIFSNLSFHLSADIDKTIQECHRLLKPGGLLLFSTLGPDTLKELRQSFNQYDPLPHVHDFLDMHDIGDMLVKSRFSEPVMDMEYITMQYATVEKLLLDLKEMGSSNVRLDRRDGLMGRDRWQKALAYYSNVLSQENKIPATHEVIYATAWKADKTDVAGVNESGEVVIPIDSIVSRKER